MSRAGIGLSVPRKEAFDKVTGQAKYTNDFAEAGLLHAKILTSIHAHANIKAIDIKEAWKVKGVKAILTGESSTLTIGPLIEDRPPLARGKVRYYGEPVALVVADTEHHAKQAVQLIKVEYEELPVVNSAKQAFEDTKLLVHEQNGYYKYENLDAAPIKGTNIINHAKIRKGDMNNGWAQSEIVVEFSFKLPQSDHIATETRVAKCQIKPDGQILVYSSTQGPSAIKKVISKYFKVDLGKVIVHTPLVGGGFGGKTPAQLEVLVVLASQAVGGRSVKIVNSREEDMIMSPCHMGMEGKVKLGATKAGKLIAAEMTYFVDCGAYSETGPKMTRATAVTCTGPYKIDNVYCDSFGLYTNHTYVTAYRGFGHMNAIFAIERAIEKMAFALGMDPFELRYKNAIRTGDSNPTQVVVNPSFFGNVPECLEKLKGLINWQEGNRIEAGNNKVRAKGLSCFWKTSSSPPTASAGVVLMMNSDGTFNLTCGAVEYGHGTKTTLAQIVAERLKMDASQIHVQMEVNTMSSPEHWKTVASMTTFMVGRAALEAAEDIIKQVRSIASIAMRCPPEELDIAKGKVYFRPDPQQYMEFKDLAHGYEYPNGNSVGSQIIGRGGFIMGHLTKMNPETGEGKTGPFWTVGAQAVEVEYDTVHHTYKILKAATVVDAGKVLNPKNAKGMVMGGMCMGLGYGSREEFLHDYRGRVLNLPLRSYKMIRFGEQPQYAVDFVETANDLGPFGSRGIAEHGVIGMPAALANALSCAAQVELSELPITPEKIWKAKGGMQ